MIKRLPLRKLYLRTVWHFQRKSLFLRLMPLSSYFFSVSCRWNSICGGLCRRQVIFLFPVDGVPFAAPYAAISVFACFLPFTGGRFAAIFFRAAP